MNRNLLMLLRGSAIAAIYIALVAVVPFVAFGPVQVRVAEALTITPFFWVEAIPGLAIGCLISNLIWSPFGPIDWILGTLATLIAAILTYALRKTKQIWLGAIPPIIINGLIVALYVPFISSNAFGIDGFKQVFSNFHLTLYLITTGQIAMGEFLAVGLVGVPLAYALLRREMNERH